MATLKFNNVGIRGIAACVPKQIDENSTSHLFDSEALKKFVSATGIERKRKVPENICTSDLCVAAAEKLISELNWNKEDIGFLIFVTQTPDYILPATSPIIQERLGLSKDCYTLDISLGCSGWIYGMSVASSLVTCCKSMSYDSGRVGVEGGDKSLILAGDTLTKICSIDDKSTYPLFGDAGTATALEYCADAEPVLFNMNSDGSGYKAIHINDGGYRNPFSVYSLDSKERGKGVVSNNLQLILDGMDVFSFGIKRAPESVNKLIETFNLDKEQIDYFIFHQANLFMNEQIRKKLKLPPEKVPYSLKDFGNTSSATIPLTMVTQLNGALKEKKLRHIACGFGVGLSWGSMYFSTDKIACPALIEL
jgi:3-oxoacyl-[acyl-carrier-protein] synthase-3